MGSMAAKVVLITEIVFAATTQSAQPEEIVYHAREVYQPVSDGPDHIAFRGNLSAARFGFYDGPILYPTPSPDPFKVYRTDEIDSQLKSIRSEIDARNRERDSKDEAVRKEVKESVTASLAALPSQLITEDVKTKIANDVIGHVQSLLEERTSAIREEIKSDFDARLTALENRLNGGR